MNTSWKKRIYARLYERMMARHERFVSDRKRRLFQDLPKTVLEIGAGTGVNLAYLPSECSWTGIEPNPYMREILRQRLSASGRSGQVCDASAESVDFPAKSFDAVISTLVLCSVADPGRALAEIRRVLKDQGSLYFLEHVAAPRGTGLRFCQAMVSPLWRWAADGCRPDQDTHAIIERAGFETKWIAQFRVPARIAGPVSPHIMGVAIRRSERARS